MSATSNLSVCVGLEYSLWASSYSSLPSSLVICIAGHRCHSIRLVAANARFAFKNWRHFCCNKVNIKAAKLAPSAGATTINSCKSAHTGLWRNGSLFSDPNMLQGLLNKQKEEEEKEEEKAGQLVIANMILLLQSIFYFFGPMSPLNQDVKTFNVFTCPMSHLNQDMKTFNVFTCPVFPLNQDVKTFNVFTCPTSPLNQGVKTFNASTCTTYTITVSSFTGEYILWNVSRSPTLTTSHALVSTISPAKCVLDFNIIFFLSYAQALPVLQGKI